ncbi:MAG: terpene cyclase/mutase family protein [Aureliella sp.]
MPVEQQTIEATAEAPPHAPQSDRSSHEMPDEAVAVGSPTHSRRGVPGWAAELLGSRSTPAFLVSVIVHTVGLLLLALLTLAVSRSASETFSFEASVGEKTPNEQPVVLSPGNSQSAAASKVPEIQEQPPTTTQLTEGDASSVAELLKPGPETSDRTPSMASQSFAQVLAATNSNLNMSFVSTGLDGRSPKERARRALNSGGTVRSEAAVENALRWLAEHQLASGGWSLVHDSGKCDGRCRHTGSPERFDPAATGLALLAFLGAGYTHQDGKYKDTVNRGVYFLYQIMEDTPQGGSFLYTSDRGMYNHGIAAFAMCEAYQMTLDPDLKRAAQRAVDFIVSAQNYVGGWGYLPAKPGDLTISGWQVMALKSAHAAGLDIPAPVTFRLDEFLKTQRLEDTHFYGYRRPEKSPTCTAIGNLIRLFRGTSTSDPDILAASEFLQGRGRSDNDVYFNYYVSLYLFHIGGPIWESWNAPVRDHLINTQATGGHEAGSWYFDNQYGKEGGRLYTTAMAAMTLEVYYRYSPIYQQVGDKFEL